MKNIKWSFAAFLAWALTTSAFSQNTVAIEDARISEVIESFLRTHETENDSRYRIFLKPTKPPIEGVTSAIPEFSKSGYLILAYKNYYPILAILQEAVKVVRIILIVNSEPALENVLEVSG